MRIGSPATFSPAHVRVGAADWQLYQHRNADARAGPEKVARLSNSLI
jgi:hypothetical protein